MILLSGHSLTAAAKLRPEALSVNLKERESSATMTLEDLTGITENSWILSDKGPGSGTVWRVKSIAQAYHNKTATVQLEHAINTLNDRVLFGEIRAPQITGTVGATTCTARQAITYILNQQSDWVLYNFSAAYETVSNPYKFDGDSLMDALETVSGTLEDAWWSYDMSVYPFRLNITARQSGVASELRPGRNLRTISKSVDRAGMFTRFYPIGKNDLHLTGTPYISKNENLYGIIAKIGTDQSRETEAELTAWANEQLNRHAEPVVNITAEGMEIAEATGEPLDTLTLGRNCRVPLNEFGTTITERIIELNYPDALFQPEVVRVTMSNKREDVTKIIADAIKGAGRSSRGSARRDKEDNAWFEDTNDHVAMVAKGVVGVDAQGNPNWTRLSQIIVSGEGIDQTVTEMQGDVEVSKTWITQNGSTVTAAAAKVAPLEDKSIELEGRLDLAAGQVSLLATATDNRPLKTYDKRSSFPATGSTSYLYYSLQDKKYYQWTGSQYEETTPGNTINRAGIIATINEDGTSTTKILGNKVLIGGAGTSVSLSDVMNITNDVAHFKKNVYFDKEVTIANTPSAGMNLYTLNFVGSNTYTMTPPDVANMIAKAEIDSNTNTLKLWKYSEKNETNPTLTFSKAASKVSGSWSGNTYQVSADENGQNLPISVTPNIHHIVKDGTDDHILNTYIGTNSGGTWTNHGNAVKLYMVQNGAKVELNNINQPSSAGAGVVTYAEKAINVSLEDKGTNYATGSTQTITPDSGYVGISRIVIGAVTYSAVESGVTLTGIPANVIKSGVTIKVGDSGNSGRHVNVTGTYGAGNLMEESVYPSLYNQVALPDPPYDGFSKVTIYAVQTTNLNTYNIIKGVTVKIGRAGDDDCIASVSGSYVPTLSGDWSGNTYTVTATPEGSISVTPNIHHIPKDGTDDHILNTYVGTNSGGTWTNHGNVVKLYLVQNGSKVELNNINQPSSAGAGVVTYAEKALNDYWDAFDAGWQRYYDLWSATYDTPGDGTYSYLARSPIDHNDGNYTKVYSGVVPGSGGTTYYSRTMRCTSIEPTYPGSSSNYYYFRLEGNYGFSTNTNYDMYRTTWPAGS